MKDVAFRIYFVIPEKKKTSLNPWMLQNKRKKCLFMKKENKINFELPLPDIFSFYHRDSVVHEHLIVKSHKKGGRSFWPPPLTFRNLDFVLKMISRLPKLHRIANFSKISIFYFSNKSYILFHQKCNPPSKFFFLSPRVFGANHWNALVLNQTAFNWIPRILRQ